MKFLFILFCPIGSGLACGIWLDRRLAAQPWFMLILALAGLILGIYAVYRVAIKLSEELNQK